MRLIPLGRPASRCALGAACFTYALGAALSLTGQAGQLRSVTEGVYSAGQAARGQQVYQAQCAECHGKAMEGTIGPPLVGDGFLSNWSARSLASLVDKIQKTMPFNLPASLSLQQSTDLAAYMLQIGTFPAGGAKRSCARRRHFRWRVSSSARRKPCRADESHRFSQFEYHLQRSGQGSRCAAEKAAGLLTV